MTRFDDSSDFAPTVRHRAIMALARSAPVLPVARPGARHCARDPLSHSVGQALLPHPIWGAQSRSGRLEPVLRMLRARR